MGDYSQKIVLVTGAGRGFGRQLALAYAGKGAFLAVNDLTPVTLNETLADIQALGAQAQDYIYDIAKKMPAQALVQQVLDDWGRIDILINAASVRPTAAILDMDDWDWGRTLDVNLSAVFYMMQAAGRVMRDQGGGLIINIAAGIRLDDGLPTYGAYLSSKVALLSLTRTAARELAEHHIRVNAVCPDVPADTLLWDDSSPSAKSFLDVVFDLSRSDSALTGQLIPCHLAEH